MTATSVREFTIEIYLEHLDEASFLYGQRKALLAGAEVLWTELQAFESRLEAHIDALVVGRELALQQCAERIAQREGGATAERLQEIRHREASDRRRYQEIYAFDYHDPSRYDAVISTDQRTPEDLAADIVLRARARWHG